MYPNPQDVLPLPPRPDVHHYRKRAKDLVRACRSGDPGAVALWAELWIRDLIRLQPESRRAEHGAGSERLAGEVARFARDRFARAGCALSQAQFVIARTHGFESWPKLAGHLVAMAGPASPISAFEEAADAIVAGDLPRLERLLADDPGLVRARSTREHHATLLHHVSANGIENYRQETPSNVVEVARRLIDAGAAVDAEADVYGGGATTLELVTSSHPRRAGVQDDLADLLLERGARMSAGLVRACLANGCPEAALHMARRGAVLSLEEAAGLGWLDEVRRRLDTAVGAASKRDSTAALMTACWYDRSEVVALLLDRGIDIAARDERQGHTALHVAAYVGSPRLVELLLLRGAPVNVPDDTHDATPLTWAMHAWLGGSRELDEPRRAVLTMLADAGADVKPEWLEDDRVRAEPDLLASLSRRAAIA